MKVCKVVGNVWATRKHKCLAGLKLLLVRQIKFDTGDVVGEAMLAVDKNVDAGIGNIVLVSDEGNSARMMLDRPVAGIRTVVCGIVDEVLVAGKSNKYN
ncbi:MAG: ethanolamine utilization protein EutN [Elusimicrobia bacterium]|nr:ethanolamine utilization protein EutN [Elusimicrobiota bacterium]